MAQKSPTEVPYRAPLRREREAQGSRTIQTFPIIPHRCAGWHRRGLPLTIKDPSQDPEDVYDAFDTMEVVLERAVSDR